ncbi:DUF899 domain-containing protein [Nocardiopsis sp. LOL_012]|uniref:DUF899 domain-containing protein n=1 Tax=Nocardiopsis sp. LOL_012 TaxID=3345409 RepID=UPI003A891CB3
MELPEIVTREEWLAARKELLVKEKEVTRARDEVSARRRALPMVRVEKEYVFEGPEGRVGLVDLFEGRGQLIVQHAMFEPEWDAACTSCTSDMDDLGHLPHLHANDVTLAVVSRAPFSKIQAYKERKGWDFPYYSSAGSDFNYDYHVTLDESVAPVQINYRSKEEHEAAVGPWDIWGRELPGVSVFLRVGGEVFHTYSAYSRGLDALPFVFNYLDLTPLGRQGM